jgi:transcriptional regulator with XRE-family HTH domain
METEVVAFPACRRQHLELAASCEQEAGPASDPAPAFGHQVAKLRSEKRLSVAEASKRAGISRQHLYRIEKGIVTNVGREIVLRIAEALQVKEALLLDTKPSSEVEAVLNVLWQHSSQLSSDDCNRLREIERNLLGTLQDTHKI